jgi:hypothetical protein
MFARYDAENLDQWAASRGMMDVFYLRQNTFRRYLKGNGALQRRMASAHNAAGTTLAYDCVEATWAHHRSRRRKPDFSGVIEELRELTGNGFILSHIGLQSVLSKPTADGTAYDIEWRIRDVVEFMGQVKPVFPDVKIGVIDACPTKGYPYQAWYGRLRESVVEAGHSLDFVHLDMPFSFVRRGAQGLSWPGVVAIEGYVRDVLGAEFGLICTDNVGGRESGNRWRDYVLDGVSRYLDAGGRPDALLLFSWYPHPARTTPDALTAIPPGEATQLRVLREVARMARDGAGK